MKTRTSLFDEVREVRNPLPDFSPAYKLDKEVRKAGLSFPDKSGKSDGLPYPPRRPKSEDLRSQRARLEIEAANLGAEVDRLAEIAAPFEAAFRLAHNRLADLHDHRGRGAHVSKEEILASYDSRMATGHAWHIPRKELRDAVNWRKRILDELRNINMGVER